MDTLPPSQTPPPRMRRIKTEIETNTPTTPVVISEDTDDEDDIPFPVLKQPKQKTPKSKRKVKVTPRTRHPAGDATATPWTRIKSGNISSATASASEEEVWEATKLIPPATPPPKRQSPLKETDISSTAIKSLFTDDVSEELPGLSDPEFVPTTFDDEPDQKWV